MKGKRLFSVALIIFMVASFVTVIYQVVSERGTVVEEQVVTEELTDGSYMAADANVDIVYYFMTSARCPSCLKIEEFTKEALNKNFSGDITDGNLVWRVIEVDNRDNIHFAKKYSLVTKSVVLSKIRDGKEVEWKNLDRVWSLLDDRDVFVDYVSTNINDFTRN